MTKNIKLEAKKRIKSENRTSGEDNLPGILYGRGIENVKVWLDRKEFKNLYEETGESTVFKLDLGESDERNVLIKEIQKNVITGDPMHVDFYQVRMDEEIEAEVELVFRGESAAVKELGGILVKNMDSVDVRCLPGDLPSKIDVDISSLKTFDDYVYVKDLPVSDKVELLVDAETVVAMVSPPRTEEELAELETEVKEDVSKVEGVVKEEQPVEGEEVKSEEKPTKGEAALGGKEEKK